MSKQQLSNTENTTEIDAKLSKIITPDFRKLIKGYFDVNLAENFQIKLRKLEFAVVGSYNEVGGIDINFRFKKHIKMVGKQLMISKSFWSLKDFKKTTSGKLYEWAKNPLEISMESEGFAIKNLVVDANKHNTQLTQDMNTFLKDSSYDGTARLFGYNVWENIDEKNVSLIWATYSFYTVGKDDDSEALGDFKDGDYVINV